LALCLAYAPKLMAKSQSPFPEDEPSRNPANYVPDDEVEVIPIRQTIWVEKVLVDDDAGVLESVRNQINDWQERENYVSQWDVEPIGQYRLTDETGKRKYLGNKLIKYLDKRLAGEVRHAEEGSYFKTVGEVQKALRPNAEASVSRNIKIKFKARALQGKAYMIVDNPYVDAQTSVSLSGNVHMTVKKDLKDLGIQTQLQYEVNKGEYVAQFDKPITRTVSARVSSRQKDRNMAFSDASDQIFQLLYNLAF